MAWLAPEIVSPLLRALVYLATITSAGAVLFFTIFRDGSRPIRTILRWQILAGFILLLIVEPLRYAFFQLQIAGGDWEMAFSRDLRSIYLETPQGLAAFVRILGAGMLLLVGLRWRFVGFISLLIMLSAYLGEGHSVSSDSREVVAGWLGLHLLGIHWWIGSLIPLYALTLKTSPSDIAATARRFGVIAIYFVPITLLLGFIVLGLLVGWEIRLGSEYQQRMVLKVILVASVLTFAAINKFWLTPMLVSDPEKGSRYLRGSLILEIALALSVLLATAWTITTAPGAEY